VVLLTISALADTTFVVFPLGSFIAARFAEVTFRIVAWLPKRCFLLCTDLNESYCACMGVFPYSDRPIPRTRSSLHNVYILPARHRGPPCGTPDVRGPGRNPIHVENQRACILERFAPRGRLPVMVPFPLQSVLRRMFVLPWQPPAFYFVLGFCLVFSNIFSGRSPTSVMAFRFRSSLHA
jgi:hypothetical protein